MNLPHLPLEQALQLDVPAINRVVERCVKAPGLQNAMHEKLADMVAECVGAWRVRAMIPIHTITVTEGEYHHPPEDLTPNAFPNGYPVLVVSFNGSKIGMIGIKRRPDGSFTGTIAELTASKLMLEPVQ